MPHQSSSRAETPMPIDVVSDIVCPWCYIGKHRLEKALALRPEISVEVRWHPFFLNPWVPREGMTRTEYLTTKFGSPQQYASIAKRVGVAAAGEGLIYEAEAIKRQPNTLDAHRLIRWARDGAGSGAMKQKLMDMYFAQGADLSDSETLVHAAVACGLDADRARQLLASDTDVAAIEQEVEAAKEMGIDGVPCFIFGGTLAVSGAQTPEHLAEAMAQAHVKWKQQSQAPVEAELHT